MSRKGNILDTLSMQIRLSLRKRKEKSTCFEQKKIDTFHFPENESIPMVAKSNVN